MLLFTCYQCTSKNVQQSSDAINITWNSKMIYPMSSIIKSCEYIILKTSTESLIKNITKLQVKNNCFFILDDSNNNNKLLVSNKNGNFIKTIGCQGRGPKEYLHISDFSLYNNHLFLLDEQGDKILVYDTTGQFIESKYYTLKYPNCFFKTTHGFIFFLPYDEEIKKDKYALFTTDEECKPLSQSCKYTPQSCHISLPTQFVETDSLITFGQFANEEFTIFNRQGNIHTSYHIEFAKQQVKIDKNSKLLFDKTQNHVFLTSIPIIISKYIYGNLWNKGIVTSFAIDLTNHDLYIDEDFSLTTRGQAYHVNSNTITISLDYSLYEHQNIPEYLKHKLEEGTNIIQVIKFK